MKTFIGIDLGTSAVKLILTDVAGKILNTVSENYPVIYPQDGWTEQNPTDWLAAVERAVPRLLMGHNPADVVGIGTGGQMHGLVALDSEGKIIRPCILWNDGRTEVETAYLNEVIGKAKLSSYTANIAFAGFTAPKLMWLNENEPKNFARISKIMLPKDYLTYCFTGEHVTDYSDASGTLLLDVKNRRWSADMCQIAGTPKEILPRLCNSFEPVGNLNSHYCKLWGMNDVTVCAGAGDNAAAAIGTGTVNDGDCNISLGTSGTVFVAQNGFSVDGQNALHSFCHANGKFHLMGCILSAASCNSWWMNILESKDFAAEQQGLDSLSGDNDVYFLPYLSGERSPHNDVTARGAFIGLTPTTTRRQMALAVMEGVAFALRDCIEVARTSGLEITNTKICGGGAKSALWRRIIADVCNLTVEVPAVEEGPAYGAAILSMVACGEYSSIQSACAALTKISERIVPSPERVKKYEIRYAKFKKLYPALKGLF